MILKNSKKVTFQYNTNKILTVWTEALPVSLLPSLNLYREEPTLLNLLSVDSSLSVAVSNCSGWKVVTKNRVFSDSI
jgi:hypothetical protein